MSLALDYSSMFDTYISPPAAAMGSSTNSQFGNARVLGSDVVLRGLLSVDLTSVPSGIEIIAAVLTLTRSGNGSLSAPATFTASRVTQAWVEATATWATYDGTHSWASAGGDFTLTGQASTLVSPADSLILFNVLELVQDAIANRSGLLNLLLQGPENVGVNAFVSPHSCQSLTVEARPQLFLGFDWPVDEKFTWSGRREPMQWVGNRGPMEWVAA